MPGVKRKASTAPGDKLPVKLKKQSTSVTLDRAIPTLTQKTSKLKKSTISKINESPNEPKRIAERKQEKSPIPPLPRFPTLVPTKPAGATGTDFVFNISPTSSPKKDNLSEINVSSQSSTSDVPELRKESTTIIKTNSSDDCPGNKASNIEKTVLRLSSGSYVGRIMNKDVDDQMLPSLESLAAYEQKQKDKSNAPFTWDMTDTDISPVRKSVYDVHAVLNLLDKDNSPTKCSLGGNTSDNDSDAPPVLQAEVYDATSSLEDYDDDASVPTLTCMGTPSKSCKSPRKMTGGPREIVFSFDTTGSMYNYMEEASYRMRELIIRVQEDMPGIRLAFVAHGDYYDLANDRYLIKWIDFGASVDEVDTFFENLPITHGGDADECYELVLRKVRESLSWSIGSQRSLVMIGDSDPHEPGYKFNDFVNDIDWRQETKLLNDMGVRIYGLQVGYTSNFYKQISQMTGGPHLRIENTDFTYDTLMSICLREGGLRHLKGYEHEVRTAAKKSGSNGGTLDLELERLFSSLKNIADNKSLKQRERENKLKARVLEMTTDPQTSATKRSSENEAGTSDKKKPKLISKSPTKVPSEKSKSSDSLSPKKLTKIKEKSVDKSKKKTSVEKMKKVSTIKTPGTKQMTPKPKTKVLKEKTVEKKKVGTKSKSTEKKNRDEKLKKVKKAVGRPRKIIEAVKNRDEKLKKVKKAVGRPRKIIEAVKNRDEKLKKVKKAVGRPRKIIEAVKNRDEKLKKVKKAVGRPRKIIEAVKPRGRPSKKGETSKVVGKSLKKVEKSKVVGKPLKKVASKSPGRPRKMPETPKKPGRPKKKTEKTKSPGRPVKVKTPKSVGKPSKEVKSPKSKITKKKETSLKSPSSVVQRIVAAKLKRLGKLGATSKVKLPKKLQTTVKTKDAKSKIKPKAITKTKVSGKAVTKLSSTKDSSKRKPVSAKLSLKKKEGKAKIAKLKSVKKINDKKKAAGKKTGKDKKKQTVKKVIKSTKPSQTTAKKNVPKGKPGKPSVQQKQKTKGSNKPVKKETKKLGVAPGKKGFKKETKKLGVPPGKKGKTSLLKKTLVKTAPVKKTPSKADNKKVKSGTEKKPSVKPKSPQKNKNNNTEQRENISGSKFGTGPLSNVKWSPWTAIISPKSNGADWSKSRSWCGGHSNETLYKGEGTTQALYEAAVVPPGSSNKYAVTYVVGQGVPAVRVWDCFTSPQIRQEVQRIVKANGAIYVRRGVIAGRAKDSLNKAEDYIKENFDYAWRGSRRTTEVRKEGFVVATS